MTMTAGYRLEDQVGFLIRKVSQRHTSIFAALMGQDLTPTQWAALVKIGEYGTVSQNLLGRETAMDSATIKGVVDRLKRRELLKTTHDPSDRRRSMIALTDLGRRTLDERYATAERITEETLAGLTDAERQSLAALLNKMS